MFEPVLADAVHVPAAEAAGPILGGDRVDRGSSSRS